jgi:isoquinoline 1-oxidoreductase beta subunit
MGTGAEPGRRDDIAKALGIKPEEMVVNCTLLGGGFGRKSKCDFAIEAAWLSRALDGVPVKVVWTREDDLHHGFYHTVTVDRFEAGLDASNKVVAWRHRSASPTILSTFAPDPKHPFDIELGMAGSTRPTCRTSAWKREAQATRASAGSARSTT